MLLYHHLGIPFVVADEDDGAWRWKLHPKIDPSHNLFKVKEAFSSIEEAVNAARLGIHEAINEGHFGTQYVWSDANDIVHECEWYRFGEGRKPLFVTLCQLDPAEGQTQLWGRPISCPDCLRAAQERA